MVIIWIVFIVLFVCGEPAHGYSRQPRTSCAAGEPRVSFTPHLDGRKGHYVAEWCIRKQVDGKLWNMKVKYTAWNESQCEYYENVRYSSSDYETLSYFSQMPIQHTGPNCTHVTCLAIDVDLVATGCFFLMNELKENHFITSKTIAYKASHHYVVSEYPNYSYFKNMSLTVIFFDNKNTVTIVYYFNEYPITTEFTLTAHLIGSQANADEDLAQNCTRGALSVECELELPYGCYAYSLRWDAPWTRFGPFADREIYCNEHCHNSSRPLRVAAAGPAAPAAREWALGAGAPLLAALAAAGALLACARPEARRRGKLILNKYWRRVGQTEPGPEGPPRDEEEGGEGSEEGEGEGEGGEESEGEGEEGGTLVLYQPEPGLAASEQPGELLRQALQLAAGAGAGAGAGARAWSLHDARSVAAMAAAPAAWLRRRLRRPRAATVALLTPAAALLAADRCRTHTHTHTHGDGDETEPQGRAVPRAPQWGETLLPYALRLVEQDAMLAAAQPLSDRRQYERNYIAVSEGLWEEGGGAGAGSVLRDVTALRRYVLPGAARALLRAVGGGGGGGGGGAPALPGQEEPRWAPEVEAQLEPLLARLEASLRLVRQRAAAQPHYLDSHYLYLE